MRGRWSRGTSISDYSPELRERAIRMVAEVRPDYPSNWPAIVAVASQLGIGSAETPRKWVRQAEVEAGQRLGVSSEESAEIKLLKRENAELRRPNEILKAASAFFAEERVAGDDGPSPDPAAFAVAASRAASSMNASVVSAHTAEGVICVVGVAAPDRPSAVAVALAVVASALNAEDPVPSPSR